MSNAPLMLGVSGLRGIVGQSLTPEVAARYAAAFGAWLIERGGGGASVVIGRDGRLGGEAIHHAAIGGLLGAGCEVVDLGIVTTPTVGVALAHHEATGGMVVTASHNPGQWNGLKCLVGDEDDEGAVSARAPSADEADQVIAAFRSGAPGAGSRIINPLSRDEHSAEAHWAEVFATFCGMCSDRHLDQWSESETMGFRCVLDAVNCSGASIAVPFLDYVGDVICLHCSGSGAFPHNPEPTRENLSGEGGLCSVVKGCAADIGFAQDPDADRLAVIDELGQYIGEEYTLALAAEALLSGMGGDAKGQTLCTNLSTSRMIEDVAARHGATVVRTPVGEANVVQAMREHDAVLGGEGNGGVIWPRITYVRDSLSAMALTLSLMSRTGRTVSQLVADINALSPGGKGYAIEKRKVDLASKADARPAVEAISRHWAGERVDTRDGVRVDFDGRGAWIHVRASNTEPIMRLIAEAPTVEAARAVLDEARRVIAGDAGPRG